jgi:HTH-type transcriptional regulator / antitoxin HigA
MSSLSKNRFQPDYSISPGEILADALAERGLSQSDLAQRTGRPIKTINEIIQGKTSITPETALQLERVLRIPSKFWLNLETNHQSFLVRGKERERLQKLTYWLDEIPVATLVKEGWIEKYGNPVDQLQEVLNFYGIASPEIWKNQWMSPKVAIRTSETFSKEPVATSAWLRQGEILSQKIQCRSFDAKTFKRSILSFRELTVEPQEVFQIELTRLCALSGVALVFVHGIPKAPISGAARWLAPHKALIQLSLRHGTDDHFWFTFFHEVAHILLHGKREVFIDDDPDSADDIKEHEANDFASDILIPPEQLAAFVSRRRFNKKSVLEFAKEIGITPGIVVGKLQRHRLIKNNQLNDLKKRLTWIRSYSLPAVDVG